MGEAKDLFLHEWDCGFEKIITISDRNIEETKDSIVGHISEDYKNEIVFKKDYENLEKDFNELFYKVEDFYDAMCNSYDQFDDVQKDAMEELAKCLRSHKDYENCK